MMKRTVIFLVFILLMPSMIYSEIISTSDQMDFSAYLDKNSSWTYSINYINLYNGAGSDFTSDANSEFVVDPSKFPWNPDSYSTPTPLFRIQYNTTRNRNLYVTVSLTDFLATSQNVSIAEIPVIVTFEQKSNNRLISSLSDGDDKTETFTLSQNGDNIDVSLAFATDRITTFESNYRLSVTVVVEGDA